MSAPSSSRLVGAPRVTVLSRPPQHRTRYIDQLLGDDSAGLAPRHVEFDFAANLGRSKDTDVVFLPHPEVVLGDARTASREQERRARRFIRALRQRRIALVSLRQGVPPRGAGPGSRAIALLDAAATARISLAPTSGVEDDPRVERIPYSHLRDRFSGYPVSDVIPGRLVVTATDTLDAAYEATLKVFGISRLDGWTLHVLGHVPRHLTASFERSAAAHPRRIALHTDTLSDAARIQAITRAEMLVISAPETTESIGTMMLALSLDRPVLVQKTVSSDAIAAAAGPGWVRTHEGPLTAETLEEAIAQLRSDPPSGSPILDDMDPNQVAERYQQTFVEAAAHSRARGNRLARRGRP